MRIVVFSDSHRNFEVLDQIVQRQPEAGLFLHLGDGAEEFAYLKEKYSEKAMLNVAGNCDWGEKAPPIIVTEVEGKQIFCTHGHIYSVKGDLYNFLEAAQEKGADIALYGHTHVPFTGYLDGIYVMNPGSVSHSKKGPPSYGVIDITPAGIAFHIVKLKRWGRP